MTNLMSNERLNLYEVEINTHIYAVGATPEEAIEAAAEAISRGDVDVESNLDAFHVKELRFIDTGWANAIPFGGEGRLTCQQFLEGWIEAERAKPPTREELEAAGQQPLLA